MDFNLSHNTTLSYFIIVMIIQPNKNYLSTMHVLIICAAFSLVQVSGFHFKSAIPSTLIFKSSGYKSSTTTSYQHTHHNYNRNVKTSSGTNSRSSTPLYSSIFDSLNYYDINDIHTMIVSSHSYMSHAFSSHIHSLSEVFSSLPSSLSSSVSSLQHLPLFTSIDIPEIDMVITMYCSCSVVLMC